MRLLGLSNFYPPRPEGGYAEIAADVMGGLAARGHEVTMLVSRVPDNGLARDAGSTEAVEVRRDLDYVVGAWRRPLPAWRALRNDRRTIEEAVAERPDAAIVWHMRGVVKAALTTLHEAGVPVFYMLHDRWVLYERPGSIYVPWARLDRMGATVPRRMAQLAPPPIATEGEVCFVSRWLEEEYARRGFRSRRRHVVPCGVDVEALKRARRAPVAEPPLRLLFAGRIDPAKGLHVALDALARVEHPYELTIAGRDQDPGYARKMRDRAEQLGLAGRVTWLGEVPRAKVIELLGDHDAIVYPSTGVEAYSLGLLEAIAAGPVIVTSAVGGPREYLVDGENALLFDPGDAGALAAHLAALARDSSLVRRLTEGAAATAPSLSLDNVVGRLERLLLDATA